MPRSPRFPAPDRPDREARLLGAVAERDSSLAWRLADQIVHRRGVAVLEALIERSLAPNQGREAGTWLAALVGLPLPEALAEPLAEAVAAPGAPPLDEPSPAAPLAELSHLPSGNGLDPWFDPPAPAAEPVVTAGFEATWLEDLAREEAVLAAVSHETKLLTEPGPPAVTAVQANPFEALEFGEPLTQDPVEAVMPRLIALAPRTAARRAPAPASLARLRAWLHDDDALAEAS